MTATLKIHGLKELEQKLTALPKKVRSKVARKANRKGAKVILDAAKRNLAGMTFPYGTGLLKKSLGIDGHKTGSSLILTNVVGVSRTAFERGLKKRIRLKSDTMTSVRKAGEVSPQVYAGWVERGFTHAPDGKLVPARPFLRKAYDERGEEAVQAIIAELQKGIEDAVGGRI